MRNNDNNWAYHDNNCDDRWRGNGNQSLSTTNHFKPWAYLAMYVLSDFNDDLSQTEPNGKELTSLWHIPFQKLTPT